MQCLFIHKINYKRNHTKLSQKKLEAECCRLARAEYELCLLQRQKGRQGPPALPAGRSEPIGCLDQPCV